MHYRYGVKYDVGFLILVDYILQIKRPPLFKAKQTAPLH